MFGFRLKRMLFAEPDLGDHIDPLPSLCRYQYAESCKFISDVFLPLVIQYRGAIQTMQQQAVNQCS